MGEIGVSSVRIITESCIGQRSSNDGYRCAGIYQDGDYFCVGIYERPSGGDAFCTGAQGRRTVEEFAGQARAPALLRGGLDVVSVVPDQCVGWEASTSGYYRCTGVFNDARAGGDYFCVGDYVQESGDAEPFCYGVQLVGP